MKNNSKNQFLYRFLNVETNLDVLAVYYRTYLAGTIKISNYNFFLRF